MKSRLSALFSFFHIFSASNFIANRQITSNLFVHHIICMRSDTRKGFIHFNRHNLKIIDIDNTIFLHILEILRTILFCLRKKFFRRRKLRSLEETIFQKNSSLQHVYPDTWPESRPVFLGCSRAILSRMSNFIYDGGLLGTSTGVKIRREPFSPPCDKFAGLKEAPRYRQNPEEHVERILFSLPLFSSLVSLAFSRGRKGGNWVPAQIAASCIFRIARKRGKGRDESDRDRATEDKSRCTTR